MPYFHSYGAARDHSGMLLQIAQRAAQQSFVDAGDRLTGSTDTAILRDNALAQAATRHEDRLAVAAHHFGVDGHFPGDGRAPHARYWFATGAVRIIAPEEPSEAEAE